MPAVPIYMPGVFQNCCCNGAKQIEVVASLPNVAQAWQPMDASGWLPGPAPGFDPEVRYRTMNIARGMIGGGFECIGTVEFNIFSRDYVTDDPGRETFRAEVRRRIDEIGILGGGFVVTYETISLASGYRKIGWQEGDPFRPPEKWGTLTWIAEETLTMSGALTWDSLAAELSALIDRTPWESIRDNERGLLMWDRQLPGHVVWPGFLNTFGQGSLVSSRVRGGLPNVAAEFPPDLRIIGWPEAAVAKLGVFGATVEGVRDPGITGSVDIVRSRARVLPHCIQDAVQVPDYSAQLEPVVEYSTGYHPGYGGNDRFGGVIWPVIIGSQEVSHHLHPPGEGRIIREPELWGERTAFAQGAFGNPC